MFQIAEPFQNIFRGRGLDSPQAAARFFLGDNPKRSSVVVERAALPGTDKISVFYKQYEYRPPSWKFLGRKSKARREFENYEVFQRLRILSAEAIACGEERDAIGRLRRAFIITREVPCARTLAEFFQGDCRDRKNIETQKLRRRIIGQLAGIARRLHGADFSHNDLVWRNILVTRDSADQPMLWLIDCPRGRLGSWSPLRHRRRLKDLALLDKVASRLCTRAERLLFVKMYLGKQRIDAEVKRLARQTLDYRKCRWPEDWNE